MRSTPDHPRCVGVSRAGKRGRGAIHPASTADARSVATIGTRRLKASGEKKDTLWLRKFSVVGSAKCGHGVHLCYASIEGIAATKLGSANHDCPRADPPAGDYRTGAVA